MNDFYKGFPLNLNDARRYLKTGELPIYFRGSVENFVEFGFCNNCHGRKCMGCIFREFDHECADDCPDCCDD